MTGFMPTISGNGRYVGFLSDSAALGGNGFNLHVFVHDRQTGATEQVDLAPPRASVLAQAETAALSQDRIDVHDGLLGIAPSSVNASLNSSMVSDARTASRTSAV